MVIAKNILVRAVDMTLIGILLLGSQQMQVFALWVVGFITVVMITGSAMKMSLETAKKIHSGLLSVSVGMAFNLAYTYALITSGSPVWAFFYILGVALVRLQAAKFCNEAAA